MGYMTLHFFLKISLLLGDIFPQSRIAFFFFFWCSDRKVIPTYYKRMKLRRSTRKLKRKSSSHHLEIVKISYILSFLVFLKCIFFSA